MERFKKLSNKEWWEYRNGTPVLQETAPPEARQSYAHYLEQMSEESIRKKTVTGEA